MPPIATGVIGEADPNREPNNPFYVEAKKLAKKNDKTGLKALDKKLAEAGYAPAPMGAVRAFISKSLED